MGSPSFHGIFSGLTPASNDTPVEVPAEQAVTIGDDSASSTGQIAVDIYEQEGYYIIRAPIAGVKLNELDVEVDGNVITIHGKRELSDEVAEKDYYLQECFWGEFKRSVTLPCSVDPKKVKATYSKDCILKVIVPKAEERVKIVRVSEAA